MGRVTSRGRVTERVVEVPWTFEHLTGDPVLDIGSCGADYAYSLPKDSVMSDFRPVDELELPPHVTFIVADARDLPYEDDTWGQVLCISTLEHIGCYSEHYGTAKEDGAREEALHEMIRVLKPGGTLLLTVPYGRGEDLGWQVVFDEDSLNDLLKDVNVKSMTFFRTKGDLQYVECTQESLIDVPYQYEEGGSRADGVACIIVEK